MIGGKHMAEIIVLDPDLAALENHKSKLLNSKEQNNILFTNYPEQALEWIAQREIGLILMENEMDVLSAIELSDMIKALNSDIVQLLMVEVTNIPTVLQTLNSADIYEILLKPFKFSEDIDEPIARGLAEYERRKDIGTRYYKVRDNTKFLMDEYDKLTRENYKRIKDYSNVLAAFTGIIYGNLKTWGEQNIVPEDELIRVKQFVRSIVREYVDNYVFKFESFEEKQQHLYELFNDKSIQSEIRIKNNVKQEISEQKSRDIFFAIYLMGILCKNTLTRYALDVSIEKQAGYYIVKMICDPAYSSINGEMLYVDEKTIRTLMHQIVENCLKRNFVKSMKGYNSNPYIAVVTAVMDSN